MWTVVFLLSQDYSGIGDAAYVFYVRVAKVLQGCLRNTSSSAAAAEQLDRCVLIQTEAANLRRDLD